MPLAADLTNRAICPALGAQAHGDLPTLRHLSGAAFALDAVDPFVLDAALDTMGWPEVLRIRKEVLPAVSKLRGLIVAAVKTASRP